MFNRKSAAVGTAVLSLALLLVAGCGGKAQVGGQVQEKPAAARGDSTAAANQATAGEKSAGGQAVSGTFTLVEGESKASYAVKEVFLLDSLNVTAIGTTTEIQGSLVLEAGALKPSAVVVDVTQLKTDKAMRDNILKTRALEINTYKTAEFAVTGMEGGPVLEGQDVAVKLKGKAKIHGVEKELTWDAVARVDGTALKLTGSVEFPLSLFSIEPPNVAGKIRVDEQAKLKVELVGKEQ